MRSAEAVDALSLPVNEQAAKVLRLDEDHDPDAEDAWAAEAGSA